MPLNFWPSSCHGSVRAEPKSLPEWAARDERNRAVWYLRQTETDHRLYGRSLFNALLVISACVHGAATEWLPLGVSS